jgi:kojibiose phosphorylase
MTFTRLDRLGARTRQQTSVARCVNTAAIVSANNAAWAERWRHAAVTIEGDDQADRALHFAAYQLLSAANPDDERTSVGARGLTGDAYSGHVFWDTEIFLLAFYTLCWPDAARAMLMYRYHTLPAARAKAARLGYRGALYAWESADTGDETTPPSVELPNGETMAVLCGLIEHHISADIAFAVHQYWQATGDNDFLLHAGAEILLETARFWASRVSLAADALFHIHDVIGPDEYHERVDDNAYTNGMAQWNIEAALDVARLIGEKWPERWRELRATLDLDTDELARWSDVAARLYTGFDPASGLFEQFRGFFDLEPIDLASYEPRNVPIDMLIGRERTARSQAIKQADVLMLISLLWDRFRPEVRAKNFRYYEPRCAHGSSLSPGVHALFAARLGDMAIADAYFRETESIDLGDTMGNLAGGVHMAALGSLWQTVVLGYAGLSLQSDRVSLEPRLPSRWTSLSFTVRWRTSVLRIRISAAACTVNATMLEGTSLCVAVNGAAQELHEGEEHTWQLDPSVAKMDGAP